MINVPAHLYDDERELEMDAIDRGVHRYHEMLNQQDLSQHPPAMRLIRDAMTSLIPAIEEAQMAVLMKRPVKGITRWGKSLLSLPADRIALITLIHMVNASENPRLYSESIANEIGGDIAVEAAFDKFKREHPKKYKTAVKYTKEWNTLNAKKLMARHDYTIDRDRTTKLHTGGFLMYLAIKHTQLFKQELVYERFRRKKRTIITLLPEARQWIKDSIDQFEILQPWFMPMVVPPRDWTGLHAGGYDWHRLPLIKSDYRRKAAIYDIKDAGRMVDAVNHLQQTPWRINTTVLEVVKQVFEAGGELGGLVSAEERPLPPVPPNVDDPEVRSKYRFDCYRVHEYNRSQMSRRRTLLNQIYLAEKFAKYDNIWFVWTMDWRGRMYPVCTALHPQADDVGKALLEFGEAKPLGEDGLYWLTIHLANCIGWDKEELSEKIRKVKEHEKEIKRWASDPLTHRGWADCDSPYRALAAAMDYCGAVRSVDPRSYASRIPVAMDGTCNGLQHLSALGRDPVGAMATNLVDSAKPSDIYADVATEVLARIQTDKHSADEKVAEAAASWEPHVDRNLCKRGTMTTPYGVTKQGMRTQILSGGLVDEVPGEVNNNLNYMRDCLHDSISRVIVKGREIMNWLQECATICSDAGSPCRWTTPLGFLVHQEYLVMKQRWVATLLQKFATWVPKDQRVILKARQIRGIAPNFIHSLDACHMGMSILAMQAEGIKSIAAVHDSFGTHACHVPLMRDIIRKEFVKLHTEDLMEMFRKEQTVMLPEPPEKGTLDITVVERSTHFVG